MYTSCLSSLPPLALIAGPTASGKSALALGLAEAVAGTVINADASQVYAGLGVLSAAPDAAAMARAPHRLFGTVEPETAWSAADWAAAAKTEIAAVQGAGGVPILVGGTGLYLATLLDGIAPVPAIESSVRAAVRRLEAVDGRAALEREDPLMASRLKPGDRARTLRSLEVIRSTGRSIAEWWKERTGGIQGTVRLSPWLLLPPRGGLYQRCDARFTAMLEDGAVEEVAALTARALDPGLPAMRTIGVREIASWLAGDASREGAVAAATQATRRYAKRQFTWFTHQPPAEWPRITERMDNRLADRIVIKMRDDILTQ